MAPALAHISGDASPPRLCSVSRFLLEVLASEAWYDATEDEEAEEITRSGSREQVKREEQHTYIQRFTDERGIYQATGDGTPAQVHAQALQVDEEAPFLPLTRHDWPEVRDYLRHGLERFVGAVDERSVEKVLNAGIEVQAAFSRLLLEVHILRSRLDLKDQHVHD